MWPTRGFGSGEFGSAVAEVSRHATQRGVSWHAAHERENMNSVSGSRQTILHDTPFLYATRFVAQLVKVTESGQSQAVRMSSPRIFCTTPAHTFL